MLKKITKLAAKLFIYLSIYFMLLPKQYFVRF